MKKIIVMLAFLAAAVSCNKEVSVENAPEKAADGRNLVPMTFTVSCDTKAVLNDGHSVSFAANDKISIFANGTNYEFTTTEGGANAVFTGTGEEASTYYALYPYSSTATINGDVITGVDIAQSSAGTGTGTFNSKKAVAVAVSNTTKLTFKHVTALLKITVPAEVDDLKEIIIFNRDNGSSNTAGALTGIFNVTPVDGGDPVIEVTTPRFQTGFVGPSGSSNPVPAGDYYLPVLPAQLTAKRGIDLKITFMDNFVGRAFNGTGLKLERAKVYNLGVVKKTDEFVYNNFEQEDITGFSGNTNALSVVENPVKTAVNNSDYVLRNAMQTAPYNSTSGFVEIASGTDYGYTKFPSSVRGNYDKIRVKMYLGTNEYYPHIRRGNNTAARPAKLNGVAVDSKATWEANVKTDDWNILEWNASQLDGGWSSFSNLATWQFRPFVDWDGNNTEGYDETTNNRLIYIDDITIVLK